MTCGFSWKDAIDITVDGKNTHWKFKPTPRTKIEELLLWFIPSKIKDIKREKIGVFEHSETVRYKKLRGKIFIEEVICFEHISLPPIKIIYRNKEQAC